MGALNFCLSIAVFLLQQKHALSRNLKRWMFEQCSIFLGWSREQRKKTKHALDILLGRSPNSNWVAVLLKVYRVHCTLVCFVRCIVTFVIMMTSSQIFMIFKISPPHLHVLLLQLGSGRKSGRGEPLSHPPPPPTLHHCYSPPTLHHGATP